MGLPLGRKNRDQSTLPADPAPPGEGTGRRGRTFSVRTLMMLVATVAAVFAAGKMAYDVLSPASRWANQARTGNAVERQHAAMMLGQVGAGGASTAIPALVDAIGDEDEQVAATAAWSLVEAAKGGRSLARIAANGGPATRDPGQIRAVTSALIAALKDPRDPVRIAAFGALNSISPNPGLIGEELVSSYSRAARSALDDPAEMVRWEALKSLKVFGARSEAPPPDQLIEILEGDPSLRVRAQAAGVIAAYPHGRDRSTLALLRALGQDQEVRMAAVGALQGMLAHHGPEVQARTSAILPELAEALASEDHLASTAAAAVLGEIGAEARPSIPALLGILDRPYALDTIVIDGRPVLDSYRSEPGFQAALALGAIARGSPEEAEVVETLVGLIRDPSANPYRRMSAAQSLAKFGPQVIASSLPVLLKAMEETWEAGDPPTPQLCLAIGNAAPALAEPDEAIAMLSSALGRPGAKIEAANALAKFGARARPALPRLRELEQSEEATEWVRAAATGAILEIEKAE